MSDLLRKHVVSHLVGVIDIKEGAAVHAVAGKRDRYRPVPFCCGDATALARHYQELGVAKLYVADLDSIAGNAMQVDLLNALCDLCESTLLLDVGWTDSDNVPMCESVRKLAEQSPHSCWIAATETMSSVSSLADFGELVAADRLVLGLDYQSGRLNSADSGSGEHEWIEGAAKVGCRAAVVLDLAAVGTAGGPTVDLVVRMSRATPGWTIYSGGGIRSADDVRRLVDAGCQHCLVATALHDGRG